MYQGSKAYHRGQRRHSKVEAQDVHVLIAGALTFLVSFRQLVTAKPVCSFSISFSFSFSFSLSVVYFIPVRPHFPTFPTTHRRNFLILIGR